jgi:hydrogenase/urease accessory protein HupE
MRDPGALWHRRSSKTGSDARLYWGDYTPARHHMLDILKELWAFLRVRKKYWLMPIVIVLVLIGGILVAVKGTVIAPFIYTLF